MLHINLRLFCFHWSYSGVCVQNNMLFSCRKHLFKLSKKIHLHNCFFLRSNRFATSQPLTNITTFFDSCTAIIYRMLNIFTIQCLKFFSIYFPFVCKSIFLFTFVIILSRRVCCRRKVWASVNKLLIFSSFMTNLRKYSETLIFAPNFKPLKIFQISKNR